MENWPQKNKQNKWANDSQMNKNPIIVGSDNGTHGNPGKRTVRLFRHAHASRHNTITAMRHVPFLGR